MLIDFEASATSLPKNAEFCIVGSGPAGMTLALELDRHARSVLLLEGGGLEWTPESYELYRGDVIGDYYINLEYARARQLGGASGHWGGWCYQFGEGVQPSSGRHGCGLTGRIEMDRILLNRLPDEPGLRLAEAGRDHPEKGSAGW